MREIRPSGSEGGVGRTPYPYPYRRIPLSPWTAFLHSFSVESGRL
jgi:hypothetical protein